MSYVLASIPPNPSYKLKRYISMSIGSVISACLSNNPNSIWGPPQFTFNFDSDAMLSYDMGRVYFHKCGSRKKGGLREENTELFGFFV